MTIEQVEIIETSSIPQKHVVFFSSGIGSWAAAKRVATQYGTDNLILLFADTLIEDEDNYRFLEDAAKNVGGVLVRIKDGRTPFEVFRDVRFLGNSRIAPCSRVLKQEQCLKWVTANTSETDKLYIGIDWSEIHRLEPVKTNWQPRTVEAPLTEPPYLDKNQLLRWAREEGLIPPRLYDMGFPHANCGGGCVRAGQTQWKHLLKVEPGRFLRWETEEKEIGEFLDKDVTFLSREVNDRKDNLSLKELREQIQSDKQMSLFDWGSCGCFVVNF